MSCNASRRLFVGTVLTALVLAFGFASPASADPGEWDPTLPKLLSAGAPGDPVAVANASLQATQQAAQATMDLGRKFLAGLLAAVPAVTADGGNARRPGQRYPSHRIRDPPRRIADGVPTPGAPAP